MAGRHSVDLVTLGMTKQKATQGFELRRKSPFWPPTTAIWRRIGPGPVRDAEASRAIRSRISMEDAADQGCRILQHVVVGLIAFGTVLHRNRGNSATAFFERGAIRIGREQHQRLEIVGVDGAP